VAATSQTAEAGFASRPPWWRRSWFLGLLLAAATFLAYQPAWNGGPIWDDQTHVVHNRLLDAPDGLKRIWFSLEAPQYYPLVFTSFRLERALWGLHLAGYHLVNLLLHTAGALLLWRLLRRLRVPGAWLAAAVFALHPVNVESVAWITERKNTLSLFFFLLSLLCYLRFDPEPRAGPRPRSSSLYYGLSLLAFALALLSKTAVAPLPMVLLLLAWWRRGRIEWRDVWCCVPFFLAALALLPLTVAFEHQAGAEVIRHDTFWSRLAGAGWGFWFYLSKAALPFDLMFVYPRWRIDPSNPLSYLPGLLVVLLFGACWRYRRAWGRAGLFALTYFLAMLLPALGFVNIYFMRYSLVSDHWQYLAIIGPIALAAAALSGALGLLDRARPRVRPVVGGALLLTLGILSWRQSRQYTDEETLWRTTLQRNPTALVALNNLGLAVLDKGQVNDAAVYFQQALAIDPAFCDAHNSLGLLLLQEGRVKEAIAQLQEAIRLRPDFAAAHNNLGNALRQDGQADAAVNEFKQSLAVDPRFALAYYNLGNGCLDRGQIGEAIGYFQKAVTLEPESPEAHYNLGIALFRDGRTDEAIAHLQTAVALRRGFADAHNNLGNLFLQKGRVDEALAQYQQAVAAQPASGPAHSNLGDVLLRLGRLDEAVAQLQEAARLLPASAEAQNTLADALIRAGRPDEAKAHLLQAVELRPDFAPAHNNLGLVLLQAGQTDQAITQFQAALAAEPNNAPAYCHLAQAWIQKGHLEEAIAQYQAALALSPTDPATLNNLAWLLATRPAPAPGDGAKAVELAVRANQLSKGGNPSVLGTLAAAYAASGRFAEAVSTARKASELALAQTNSAQASALQAQIKLYQSGVPFRDPSLTNLPAVQARP